VAIITEFRRDAIAAAVQAMYTDVARSPDRTFHFPTGRKACALVGYPEEVLAGVPETAIESFAGVGYPFAARVIRPGDTVLDVGSGSGTDAFIARALVGPAGRVLGLDCTPAMREKLRQTTARAEATNIDVLEGDAEAIPLPDRSVDVVATNGVLNLVPDKRRAIAEIARVLRPGGRLQLADIALQNPPSDACRAQPELWAECIVGATTEDEYLELLREAGFTGIEILRRLDYFAASENEETRQVAASFGARAIVLRAAREA